MKRIFKTDIKVHILKFTNKNTAGVVVAGAAVNSDMLLVLCCMSLDILRAACEFIQNLATMLVLDMETMLNTEVMLENTADCPY